MTCYLLLWTRQIMIIGQFKPNLFILCTKRVVKDYSHGALRTFQCTWTCMHYFWCDFDRASSLICGSKMPTRCNRGFYCRSCCLLNMFRAALCPSSGAQEYYTEFAPCGIWCCGFQVVGLVWSWGLCVRFAGCCSILQTGHTTLSPKHFKQAVRFAIKTSVASSWHFISTY